jgi:hypothetical protein
MRFAEKSYGLAVVVLVLLMTSLMTQSSSASSGEYLPPYPVPSGSAFVNGGRIHHSPWVAFLHVSHKRPCLELLMSSEAIELCEQPLPVAVSSLSTGSGSAERSLVGLVGAPNIRHVYLNFSELPDRMVALHQISPSQAKSAHVSKRLRLAVQALYGRFCLRRFSAYGSGGHLLYRSLIHEAC